MAGNTGSPLCAELNRIANYGVYPDRDDFLEEQGAANVWAGTSGQGLLGALNYIVDPNRTDNNYKGLTAVCNELAGTTGLSDVDALRTINHPAEVLLKGTTARSASYYVDAATPRYNYPGFVYFNGASGIITPNATALDITGDIDVRAKIALDDWSPAVGGSIMSKWLSSSNFSYYLSIEPNGTLGFFYSTNGTIGTANFKYSTVATGVADGATKWVRATRSSSTGNILFYLSDDGTNWTQLGATVTSTPNSIFSSTAGFGIMGNSVLSAEFVIGKLYQAQVFASINGTDKRLDVDLTTNVTSATYDQFIATTGQLCTINGQNILTNAGTAGSLLPTTVGSSTSADSNDPKFLDHTGTNYVYTPGVASNYLSVPDSAALDITGDIDLRAQVAADDWALASNQSLISKFTSNAGNNYSYWLRINSGLIGLSWSPDGSNSIGKTSTTAFSITNGTVKWIRATLDVDNGASGNDVKFFTSDNGTTWTQLGTTVTTAGVTSIFSGAASVEISSVEVGSNRLTGKVYRAQILNGIDGTTVLDVDTSVITTGAATSFTAVTGQTVTINRSTSGRKTVAVTQPTWLFGTDDYMEVNNRYMAKPDGTGNYLYLPGVSSNNASTPDAAALDVTGDIDIRVKVALDDWTPAAVTTLVSKWISTQQSYIFSVQTNGVLKLEWSSTGSNSLSRTSTVATGVTDGAIKWVRAILDVDNGASGHDVIFYTSDDGITWTQLGTTVTTAGTTSIFASTRQLEIGTVQGIYDIARGKFFRAQVLNGIGGTTVFDANFENSITSLNQATFTESSTNGATVTINRSGSTFRSAGVIDAGYLYPGATNTFSNSTTDFLNMGANQDFTVVTISRQFGTTNPAYAEIISKHNSADFSPGYAITLNASVVTASFVTPDGTNKGTAFAQGYTSGNLATYIGYRSGSTVALSLNAANPTTATGSTNSLSNVLPLRIARNPVGLLYHDMEFISAAVFRNATLTTKNISDINNYFQGRD